MSSCAILGASGHGKVIAELAELNGFKEITFFDDRWPELQQLEHWSVCGDTSVLITSVNKYDLVVVAIGNNSIRLEKNHQLKNAGGKLSVLVHPSAVVSKYASLGDGTVVMANAVINSFTDIGEACIINTSSTIDHDTVVDDGVHVSPGANLAGGVKIGANSWIGIGAQVKQLVVIGENVIVGAGSTVLHDVLNDQIVVGTPAHSITSSH
ncbi:acetyltransferase [Shewanella alkalitolerans]|uniref:acetyltransferase n=1 Tax=Shewanella alkalitolerans TaxID=2864209 RepID=UPI001C65B9BD|nr:acetyltransferase [Shewanella alkalitolerans]QYJ98963.1 acetyltransferase [Shewanella alkalitolerans]